MADYPTWPEERRQDASSEPRRDASAWVDRVEGFTGALGGEGESPHQGAFLGRPSLQKLVYGPTNVKPRSKASKRRLFWGMAVPALLFGIAGAGGIPAFIFLATPVLGLYGWLRFRHQYANRARVYLFEFLPFLWRVKEKVDTAAAERQAPQPEAGQHQSGVPRPGAGYPSPMGRALPLGPDGRPNYGWAPPGNSYIHGRPGGTAGVPHWPPPSMAPASAPGGYDPLAPPVPGPASPSPGGTPYSYPPSAPQAPTPVKAVPGAGPKPPRPSALPGNTPGADSGLQ